jgi:hypothetical protein
VLLTTNGDLHKSKMFAINEGTYKGVGMTRVNFDPISETVYIDIILNTIIKR